MSSQTLDHVFEQHGMGEAPYALVGVWTPPSRALLSANPEAYNNAMRDRPSCCGFACAHCGTPITNHFIVADRHGDRYAIGCDCAEKVGDSRLVSQAHKAKLKVQREQRRAKREAKQQAERERREAELEAQCARNGGMTDAEVEQETRRQDRERFEARCAEIARPILDVLENQTNSPFCLDIANSLKAGRVPGEKARQIIREIAAKQHGRRGSKAYEAAMSEIEPQFDAIFDALESLNA